MSFKTYTGDTIIHFQSVTPLHTRAPALRQKSGRPGLKVRFYILQKILATYVDYYTRKTEK